MAHGFGSLDVNARECLVELNIFMLTQAVDEIFQKKLFRFTKRSGVFHLPPYMVKRSGISIEEFSIEWRKTKIMTPTNHKGRRQVSQLKLKANTFSWREARENLRECHTIGFGLLIGWESVANFLNQSQCKTKANATYFRLSSENRSNTDNSLVQNDHTAT